MQTEKKKAKPAKEKQWANPQNPVAATDERYKEQLIRQYTEAKRRKDNLTTDKKETEKHN
jgi:hypothetical protein